MSDFFLVGRMVEGNFFPINDPIDGKLVRKLSEAEANEYVKDMIAKQHVSHDLAVAKVEVRTVYQKRDKIQ